MLRRIVGGFALAAVFAAGAQAQAFQESFTFVTDNGSGQYFNGYEGQFNDSPNPADLGVGFPDPGTAFQVWCVDENDFVYIPETYNVWVTPMSASLSHTYQGANGTSTENDYRTAAALASTMSTSPYAITAQNDNLQYAIWKVLGYDAPPHGISGYNFSDYDETTVDNDITAAEAEVSLIDPNQWLIITATDAEGRIQEFITEDTFRPQSLTPEPATMGMLAMGLIGMAGAGLRRRKRR